MISGKPVIGVVFADTAKRDSEMRIRTYVSRKYSNALRLSGAIPIYIPCTVPETQDEALALAEEYAAIYLPMTDGILLAGGEDVHPRFQGEEPQKGLGETNPFRDVFELTIARMAYAQKKPILGICRGIQLIAIALGGKVFQDIASHTEMQHSQNTARWGFQHKIKITPGSRLEKIAPKDDVFVNSFHHQAVRECPANFFVSAVTADGLIEAMESADSDIYCCGVQWHPEETFHSDAFSRAVFKDFVDAAGNTVLEKRQEI
ncbi:MAG: gamma-glutamyl-gamma-aminobutyrate hydrolase family protein [Candidatus Riflebacteria bacterium]|nr:gamma-glutamyl-gamma-aminobutyrate hydrolase family protein [Candidatus Riflebacteria bacterium]